MPEFKNIWTNLDGAAFPQYVYVSFFSFLS